MTSSSSHGQSSQDKLSEFFSSSLSLILIGEVVNISQADFLWAGWRIIV